MSADAFDTLTDWIGIPLVAVTALLFLADEVPAFAGRATPVWARQVGRVLAVVVVGIVIARFVRLA